MEYGKEDRSKGSGQERAEVWQQRLQTQEASSLSARQFCTEQGLSLPQFYYWRRRLRPEDGHSVAQEDGATSLAPAFVELGLSASPLPASRTAPLEIRLDLGGGCILSIRRG